MNDRMILALCRLLTTSGCSAGLSLWKGLVEGEKAPLDTALVLPQKPNEGYKFFMQNPLSNAGTGRAV